MKYEQLPNRNLEHRSHFLYLPSLRLYVAKTLEEGDISALTSFRKAPTLKQLHDISQLTQASENKIVCERGEWTSDFVDFAIATSKEQSLPRGYVNAEYISKPLFLFHNERRWNVIGGKRFSITLPPNGWVIPNEEGYLFNPETGTPLKTTQNLDEAEASGYSYLWRGAPGEGLLAVNRECERLGTGSFDISIVQSPDFTHENISVRKVFSAQQSLTNY